MAARGFRLAVLGDYQNHTVAQVIDEIAVAGVIVKSQISVRRFIYHFDYGFFSYYFLKSLANTDILHSLIGYLAAYRAISSVLRGVNYKCIA